MAVGRRRCGDHRLLSTGCSATRSPWPLAWRCSPARPAASAESWPAYAFALGFGLLLLVRRRHPVLVVVLTSLGICVYYALEYPPIGLALPIAVALFSVAEAGRLRVGIVVSTVLLALSLYFQIVGGQDPRQLLGYELPPVIALMGASLALGDGVRSRRLLRESQRERERQALLELERRATEQRNEERLRLARDLHDALGHNVAMMLMQSAVALRRYRSGSRMPSEQWLRSAASASPP